MRSYDDVDINILVKSLVKKIRKFCAGEISSAQLEDASMSIIAHDNFDTLDDELQNLIYVVDSKEIEELTITDMENISQEIEKFVNN